VIAHENTDIAFLIFAEELFFVDHNLYESLFHQFPLQNRRLVKKHQNPQ
jgi:hypothetical protein